MDDCVTALEHLSEPWEHALNQFFLDLFLGGNNCAVYGFVKKKKKSTKTFLPHLYQGANNYRTVHYYFFPDLF